MATPKALRVAGARQSVRPAPVTVACDDLTIEVGGATYHPRVGQTITLRPLLPVGGIRQALRAMQAVTDLQAAEGDAGEQMRTFAILADMTDDLIAFILLRLIGWDWTDDEGQPLGPPTAATLGTLTQPEIRWLAGAAMGETAAQRKND